MPGMETISPAEREIVLKAMNQAVAPVAATVLPAPVVVKEAEWGVTKEYVGIPKVVVEGWATFWDDNKSYPKPIINQSLPSDTVREGWALDTDSCERAYLKELDGGVTALNTATGSGASGSISGVKAWVRSPRWPRKYWQQVRPRFSGGVVRNFQRAYLRGFFARPAKLLRRSENEVYTQDKRNSLSRLWRLHFYRQKYYKKYKKDEDFVARRLEQKMEEAEIYKEKMIKANLEELLVSTKIHELAIALDTAERGRRSIVLFQKRQKRIKSKYKSYAGVGSSTRTNMRSSKFELLFKHRRLFQQTKFTKKTQSLAYIVKKPKTTSVWVKQRGGSLDTLFYYYK